MSILTKPYEISVWEDVWNGEKFVEKRLGVIGSSTMSAQCRVFSPNLTQKTNGTKEFSFQLYKRYIDNITGKEVNNPFYDWLVNERKVKLQYDGKWYDFIIKNIQENSSTYQYTYKLEDALVQELSKNGFNAEFDDSLMNNSGTADELAKKVLVETDWEVSENSEAFVEGIEEALIYLSTTSALKAYQVIDQDVNNLKEGVTVSSKEITIPEDKVILAFYSSCVDKPYRFQFIYVDDLSKLTKDDNRLITNKNCQYFIDNPKYGKATKPNKFYLPIGLDTTTIENEIVSGEYRAKRYGFAQESIFIPVLNRYVNVYEKGGKEYYGYLNTNYVSSTLTQNYISNTQFKNTSGWTGTKFASGTPAKVENVTGRFFNNSFINVIDEVANMSKNKYSAYMKLTIGKANSLVLNSGPRDNRLSIGRIEDGEEWALVYKAYDKAGKSISLNFGLGEYTYVSQRDGEYNFYEEVTTNCKLHFNQEVISSSDGEVQVLFTAVHDVNDLTATWFKKSSEIRLAITAAEGEYYIESISLFKVVRDSEGKIILPENQAGNIANQVIDTNYYFFAKEDIEGITNEDELNPPIVLKEIDYEQFTPKMIKGAQKIRTIQGKESNYFNLLQSIAEKFEAWLDFEITRDEQGAVTKKKIVFRNYLGKTNHVGFKYGVNLKDIQRTFESKQIVTKLIVKDNSNEFANNGFCSIAKASANPTGENYVYDFQYFFNRGMLNAKDYLNTLYVYDGASGDDILDGGEYNLKGYFPRIKAINQQIDAQNEIIFNLSKDITSLSAKFQVAQAGYEAAQGGLEQCNYDFQATVPTDKSIPEYLVEHADIAERTDVKKILQDYTTYQLESDEYEDECEILGDYLSDVQEEYNTLTEEVDKLGKQKAKLNTLFFSTYSRYIQEGTWIEESYVDDNKYYADSLSVMYNSCYPKASYTINVLNISKLPGYEGLSYGLGDKTYIEDSDFFGSDQRVEIVVTEISENLDDPSQDKIKVQTFKNQFQDLFQKITASVQSAQLKEGSYEKAVALAEAGQERKKEFVTDALAGAGARLQLAGQQSVTYGDDGLTITDVDSPSNSIRMIGGAILLSKQDKNGQTKWTTGLTSDGIAADLITAGILNVGEISIMNHNEPVFRWDSFGISAFDAKWVDAQGTPVISSINTDRFVRFDKFGIYGINGGRNGLNWYPTGKGEGYEGNPINEINDLATFALTWDGLFFKLGEGTYQQGIDMSLNNGTEITFEEAVRHSSSAKIGRIGKYIYNTWYNGYPSYDATKGNTSTFVKILSIGGKNEQLAIYDDGTLVANNIKLTGSVSWVPDASPSRSVYGPIELINSKPPDGWLYTDIPAKDPGPGTDLNKRWHKERGPKDVLYSHTDTAGAIWEAPAYINGQDATVYVLSISPNSWNKTDKTSIVPEIDITKYVGDAANTQTVHLRKNVGTWETPCTTSSGAVYDFGWKNFQGNNTYVNTYKVNDLLIDNISSEPTYYIIKTVGSAGVYGNKISDYTIKANGVIWYGSAITNTTTFELWSNDNRIASETVVAVSDGADGADGKDGADGAPGKDGADGKDGAPALPANTSENIRVFCLRANSSRPEKPGSSLGTSWTTSELTATEDNPYVWTCTGNKVTTYSWTDANKTSYTSSISYGNWTTPELWGAWGADNINQKTYATFLTLMNGQEGAIAYDSNGKLYIKAELVQANNVLVKDKNGNTVLSATSGGSTILGNFTVDQHGLIGYDKSAKKYLGLRFNTAATDNYNVIFAGGEFSDGANAPFRVTRAGGLYSTYGRIGDCSIVDGHFSIKADNIEFSSGDFGGTNLLLNSGEKVENKKYNIATYTLAQTPEQGKTYTVTIKGKLQDKSQEFRVYNSGYYIYLGTLVSNATGDLHSLTFQWSNNHSTNPVVTPTALYVFIKDNNSETTENSIEWIKLEEGPVPTAWSPAPADQVSTNQTTGVMKWRMIPSACIWWNENTSESLPLMKLDSTGLTIRGTVYATAGEIGGCKIEGGALKASQAFAENLIVTGKASIESIVANKIAATTITANSLTVKRTDNTVIFQAPVGSGKSTKVQMGGKWFIDNNSIYTYGNTDDNTGTPTVFLRYEGLDSWNSSIGGTTRNYLILKIGDRFGVDKDGTLYASSANISGTLTAGDNSSIAGWVIQNNSSFPYIAPSSFEPSEHRFPSTYNGPVLYSNRWVQAIGTSYTEDGRMMVDYQRVYLTPIGIIIQVDSYLQGEETPYHSSCSGTLWARLGR